MSFDQSNWVWINGDILPWERANTHVSAHALHYGTGVFEGMRCYGTEEGPAVFRMDAHLARLYESAAVYGIEIGCTPQELTDAVCEVISRNGFMDCYIRPVAYCGSGSLGIRADCPVSVAVLAWPWANHLGDEGVRSGVSATISPWRKFHSSMMPTTAKACGQYLNSRLAVREAMSRGFDEAILLNAVGDVAEGAVENIFLVRGQTVVTNDERSSILLGITRDTVIEIACGLGYQVSVETIRVADLLAADEAFFTGTAAEVTPIRRIDSHVIGGGRPGPVTEEIQKRFFDIVRGRNEQYLRWLHFVTPEPVMV